MRMSSATRGLGENKSKHGFLFWGFTLSFKMNHYSDAVTADIRSDAQDLTCAEYTKVG